jgi:streptomycin 6-kinase
VVAYRCAAAVSAGGASAWVAPARTADGLDAVLKVGWTHDEALHEADGLRFWAGDGAVVLYASRAEGATTALLLERCRPGTPLNEAERPERQDVVVTEVLRRLWPYVGDPAYDPAQYMLNNPGRLMSDRDGFIDRIADLAGVDRERLAQWVFARCVSESIHSRPLREVAETMAAVI